MDAIDPVVTLLAFVAAVWALVCSRRANQMSAEGLRLAAETNRWAAEARERDADRVKWCKEMAAKLRGLRGTGTVALGVPAGRQDDARWGEREGLLTLERHSDGSISAKVP